ncbi:hypothetical protein A2U01_0023140, partial [Trifolium medium]|nr:hypothetical protein [Trifolium medium]
MKGVVLFDLNNRDILVSRNINHHEHIFPNLTKNPQSTWAYYPSAHNDISILPGHDSSNECIPTLDPVYPSNTPNSDVPHTISNDISSSDSRLAKHPRLAIPNSDTSLPLPSYVPSKPKYTLLVQEGYHQSNSNYSLFTMKDKLHFTEIVVYVDDIIIA